MSFFPEGYNTISCLTVHCTSTLGFQDFDFTLRTNQWICTMATTSISARISFPIYIHQPRKLKTKKCRTIEPSAKSANARSGDTSLNSSLFSGLTCDRNDAVNTNCPIVLANPAKKALNGKLVTRIQYKNWSTPESMINSRKESMNFRRSGVCSL